ncbi:MAG: ribonuclease HI [Candidatus Xenolissoclinum pacificiensis L6]|uniref:Ribonuclease H n=1 Tax=Candidatus Xenolissoclinum pacificiensis L6 TaxID=1401685 RepID=W2V0N5_9RICK|nr:MAG: ribonuclease HI [Candidatus Xenolissoclinum pacificiensis L6]
MTVDLERNIEIFTDGSCSGNPGIGGWGFIILSQEKEYRLSGAEKDTTNNRMEMIAVIEGLSFIDKNFDQSVKIRVNTDSTYLKNGIVSWIKKWKVNNWKTSNKTDVKNRDLWVKLDYLNSLLCVEWFWVKGHSDNKYNNKADSLAREACEKLMRDEIISDTMDEDGVF